MAHHMEHEGKKHEGHGKSKGRGMGSKGQPGFGKHEKGFGAKVGKQHKKYSKEMSPAHDAMTH